MLTLERNRARKRPVSGFAMAIALATGAALTVGLVAEPAQAQRKKKDEGKPNYTKELVAAYQAAQAHLDATPPDVAAAKAAVPSVLAAATTPDDKLIAGQLVYNTGVAAEDLAMQRQGLDLMIDSGKVAAERQGQYYYNAGQLAYQADDFAAARARFEQARGAGYANADLVDIIATTYLAEDNYAEGVKYFMTEIDKVIANGGTPSEDWLFRAFSGAYNGDLAREAIKLSALSAEYYPGEKNWRNAISVQRNYIVMEDDVLLDLLRLADRTGTLESDRDYVDYITATDPRRLPGESDRVLKAAIAAGVLESNDPFVGEARSIINSVIKADRADVPALERDARKPGATALTTTAAGDVFLSYGNAATAEEMYQLASQKTGAKADLVMLRMGIAQFDQGKFAEARETFSKVGGSRQAVAMLWEAYAGQKLEAAGPETAPAETTSL